MFLLGGTCFRLIGLMERKLNRVPAPARMLAGAGLVTALELATGLALNRDHRIWDYRMLPLHYRGQICLLFSLLWAPLSLLGGWLCRKLDRRLS